MRIINSFDKEAEFESLEEAKEYYYPDIEMTEENKAWEEYKNYIKEAGSLKDLADVLNRYSNEFDNGSRWKVVD